jgi:hypothetical protein
MGGYPMLPQQEACAAQFGYASMPSHAMMQQFSDAQINAGVPGMHLCAAVPPSPAPMTLAPPGLPAPPGLAHATGAATPADKNVQLTELTVQIHMLSSEVRRLQSWIIPNSMQSTNSGSPMESPDRTPNSGNSEDNDPRSFEQKVASLQDELKRLISDGQRSGKIPMK